MLPDQVHPFQSCPHSDLPQSLAGSGVLGIKNKQTLLWGPTSTTPCSRKELLLPQPSVIPLELHQPGTWGKLTEAMTSKKRPSEN